MDALEKIAKKNILFHPDNRPKDNNKTLGSAVGSPAYIKSFLVKKLKEIIKDIDKIYKVTDIQTQWCYLFYIIRN